MGKVIREEVADFKRERILAEAARRFYAHGYDGARVDEIARDLGVTKPYIYYQFSNKTEILDEICVRVTAHAVRLLQDALDAEHEPLAQLEAAVRALSLWAMEHQEWIAIYFREEKYLSAGARRRVLTQRRRFDRMLDDLLQRGVASGVLQIADSSVATQALTGMITWIFVWYREGGRLTREALGDQMVRLAFNMLGATGR